MDVLTQINQWPVDHAVTLVLDSSGEILGSIGDTDRRYPLASVTKLLSSYAFLLALEEEAITLQDPAGPESATVHHLLAHTAGYDFDSDKIRFEPGAKRGYSNTGFDVLAQHLEESAGIGFSEYVTEAVFAPLGMNHTTLEGSAAKDAVSTAADLSRFAAELLRPTLVAPQTLQDATSVHFPGVAGILPGYGRQNPNDWGLGFEIRGTKSPHWTGDDHPASTFGHFGQSGTFLWVDPEHQLACVTLTDKAFGSWAAERWSAYNTQVLQQFS